MSDASSRPVTADAAVLRALATARLETRAMSDRLLDHLPDLGDIPTQRLLDTWVEQAADALRALSEATEERLLELGRASAQEGIPRRYAAGDLALPARPAAPGGGPR